MTTNLEPTPFQLLDIGDPFMFQDDWDSAFHKTGEATYSNGITTWGVIIDPARKLVLRLAGREDEPSIF